ncbi:SAM-dependent methyltransferase [Halarcobacter ebronensis]|uniref:Cyclopropane-fatty-acyl-phospholipid synthase n=1 Tax=Halarcobacter ebronensis TaxID=1462615 RepID=A0A4Q1AJ64_9BACT|nr:cyclopropane-fatty-acyl-phospholipid synthase family protein [Halarcobacter ebronensis]QKF82973.1 cyclopropane fatty acyl phospholipid synthase [Halarcobacter ebronensis]RXK02829.1 cyclopropane-fatty-acyl-phospholipid synthase [Halarcobacter ebronensis]
MNFFWKRIGEKFLSKIEYGDLEVQFPNNQIKKFGNGTFPKAKLILNNWDLFRRLSFYGDIGFAESYMDKDFECEDLTSLIQIALINSKQLQTKSEDEKKLSSYNLFPIFNKIKHNMRKNSKTKAQKNISKHYDLSNDFFKLFLDDTMMYSSAVFSQNDETLFEAQQRKIELLAKKLNLKKDSKVLEIGSGWGAMALHLVKEYQCEVKTLTLSKEQKRLCEQRFKENKIEEFVDVLLKDYRDMNGKFDAIIAVEMFEAVGQEYFHIFFKKCEELLKENGVLVMQIITIPDQRYKSYSKGTDFIQKYIFPGGHLPSVNKILNVTSKHTKLNLLSLDDYTEHYAKTLNIWHKNFKEKLEEVKKLGFDEYFIRMWEIYLCYCEAGFLTRNINLIQISFTRYENMQLNKGLVA